PRRTAGRRRRRRCRERRERGQERSGRRQIGRASCRERGEISVGRAAFKTEDGIRDRCVTGVQTCALPSCHDALRVGGAGGGAESGENGGKNDRAAGRSGERRVGKEGRSRWGAQRSKQKTASEIAV